MDMMTAFCNTVYGLRVQQCANTGTIVSAISKTKTKNEIAMALELKDTSSSEKASACSGSSSKQNRTGSKIKAADPEEKDEEPFLLSSVEELLVILELSSDDCEERDDIALLLTMISCTPFASRSNYVHSIASLNRIEQRCLLVGKGI